MSDGILYIVGTPIGNLKDITYRAVEVLKSVDLIACEDTRHSLKLLNFYEIKKPLVSYYKEKEQYGSDKIIEELLRGKTVALITDAGMPCVSDPGSVLVLKAREHGIKIEVVPGPSAVIAAYALSGDLNNGFMFIGFLPPKNKERNLIFEQLYNLTKPFIIYSAPHDVKKDLQCIYEALGNREVVMAKELTKIHESVITGKISQILNEQEEFKGEYVVIIKPLENKEKEYIDPKEKLNELIALGVDKKEAIKKVSKMTGLVKDDVYKIFLEIK